MEPHDDGKEPARELEKRISSCIPVMELHDDGKEPARELEWRCSCCIPVMEPHEDGNEPVRELEERSSFCIPIMKPHEDGKEPVILVSKILISSMDAMLPRLGVNVPTSLLSCTNIDTSSPSTEQLTPCQLQASEFGTPLTLQDQLGYMVSIFVAATKPHIGSMGHSDPTTSSR